MLVLIESAMGIHRAAEILAAGDRVETGIFGFVDFMLDLGIDVIDTSEGAEELLLARSSLVLAARVAQRRPPLDGPFIDISAGERFLAPVPSGSPARFRRQDADPPLAGRARPTAGSRRPPTRPSRRAASSTSSPRPRQRRRRDRRRRPARRLPGDDAGAADRRRLRARRQRRPRRPHERACGRRRRAARWRACGSSTPRRCWPGR